MSSARFRGGVLSSARPLVLFLFAVVGLALGLRLVALGYRVAYYDEAWFGYWILKYLDHGQWEYAATLHGPFFARINTVVFSVLGPSDMTARLVVALLGGFLPLSAWLFRERLPPVAVGALAIILALNPILLYYSRFMRKDFPLAAFMLVTLGLAVRFADTRRPRYLYAAGGTLALAFTTKESVLLWLLTWLGAGLLVVDRIVLKRTNGRSPLAIVRPVVRRLRTGLRFWLPHLVGTGLLFLVIIIFFYAPRSPGGPGLGLWKATIGGRVELLPALIVESTVGSARNAVGHWAGAGKQNHAYLPYLLDTLYTLRAGALGVVVLAVIGFLHDRYGAGPDRPLVDFNFFAGVAATLGYPLANHLPVPWSTIHAVVPFAIPAAVGVAVIVDWARNSGWPALPARIDTARTRTAIVSVVLLVVLAGAGTTAYQTSFAAPHESPRGPDGGSPIIYYAQPPGDLRIGTDAIRRAAATGGDDLDVLYVGYRLEMSESAVEHRPETEAWHARMPLPWYTEAYGADVASVRSASTMHRYDTPPVVVATLAQRDRVDRRLGDEYTTRVQPMDDLGDRTLVFFIESG